MYCRECGEEYTNSNAAICVKCGVKRGHGNRFCPECGRQLNSPNAEYCMNCGIALRHSNNNVTTTNINPKSKVAAALFAFFLGGLGIHRFYLGYTGIGAAFIVLFFLGFLTLITWFVIWIWSFVEFILILTGSLKDANGQPLI